MAQKTTGAHAVLSRPSVYDFVQHAIGAKRARSIMVRDHIRPRPGDRILDIGCGTGELFGQLPDGVEYVGFDLSADYIESARANFGDRARFECVDVADYVVDDAEQKFDVVLALGVLHHLDDEPARALMRAAARALRPGGRFLSRDGTYIDGQPRVAKALLDRDRGRSIRTPEQYLALAEAEFDSVAGHVRGDTLRVPYTVYVLEGTVR